MARTPGVAGAPRTGVEAPAATASRPSFHANDPYPIYLERGQGSHVWDVDGTEYLDFHGGFGVNVVGHAHPKIVEAIERAARTGTHFAATTPTTVALAEELCRRFHLDTVRFANSGTEATMDAIRSRAAATGRDDVAEDRGLVPRAPRHRDVLGGAQRRRHGRARPARVDADVEGHPGGRSPTTRSSCRSTTSTRSSRMLADRGAEIACLIMEPVMMNIGIVVPAARLPRGGCATCCTQHGVVLIFDEVKSGATIAAGGADRALRRAARPRLLRQGHRRRHAHRRVRRRRPSVMDGDRARRRAAGHVQRQPAGGGGRARRAHRGADPRRLRAPRRAGHPAGRRLRARRSPSTASPRTPSTSAPRGASRTGPSRCTTTATSSRRAPSSSTRRTRGSSTAACS